MNKTRIGGRMKCARIAGVSCKILSGIKKEIKDESKNGSQYC